MSTPARLVESQQNGRQANVHEALQRNHYALPHPPAAPSRPADAAAPQISPGPSPMNAIQARIRRYNSDIDPKSDTYRAAVLLLAGLEWGQNIDALARRTGIDRSFVAKAARRLIDNGVWAGGRTVAEWTALDEASGPFWSDVAVAEGKLCRRTTEDGTIEWAPAGFWNKGYHFVDAAVASAVTATYFDAGDRATEAVPLAAELADSADSTVQQPAPAPATNGATPPTVQAEVPLAPKTEQLAPADAPAQDDRSQTAADNAQDDDDPPTPPSLMEIFSDAVWLR